jgi:hypothetical protein
LAIRQSFDEDFLLYISKDMIEGKLSDEFDGNILSELQKDVKWIEYNDHINLHDFEKVHVKTSADQLSIYAKVSP